MINISRNNVNSVFGNYTASRFGTYNLIRGQEVQQDAYITDKFNRELPEIKEQYRNNRLSDYFNEANHVNYIVEKNGDLAAMARILAVLFRKRFKYYLNRGASQEDAEKYAKDEIDREKVRLLEIHDIKFPVPKNK